jgi:N,N-dimethylformamidase beta subunit-like protein
VDRRQFLATAGRLGLGAGLASIAAACGATVPNLVSRLPVGPVVGVPGPPSGPSVGPSAVPPPTSRDTRIADENRRTGNSGWDLRGVTGPNTVEMFASAASVAPGDVLDLHLRSRSETTIEWYRLGWYGGAGGRLMRVDRHVPAAIGGPPIVDPVSGRAEAPDPVAVSVPIPADWPSGLYLAVARPPTGAPSSTPFSVRPAPRDRPAPVLFVSAAATWQAYNPWGGADLYDASTADTPDEASGRRAVQVSFDRPHALQHGAGFMPNWELPFVRWQERNGRAVDYCADVDLELHPEVAGGRRLIVFAGHHEYWSRPMRTTLETAIATGVNVAFLSANEIYWQIRLESSPLGPGRRITCWKSRLLDPITASQPGLTTCRWREQPVDDPEAVLIGQMYGHIVRRPADWIVTTSGHWLYEGTRFRDGDRIVNLVGQEYDTFFPEFAPAGTTILARSPVQAVISARLEGGQPTDPRMQTATIYTSESGATVLAAGTFQWSWALDGYGSRSYRGFATPRDPRVERMTRNVFDRLGDGPLMV